MSDEELKVQDAIVNGLIGHYEAVIEQYKAEIEQLKSMPVKSQKPCEDTISRHVVKEQMIKYGFHAPDMTVTEFVEDLPSVKPQEPKTNNDLDMKLKLMEANINGYTQGLKDASNTEKKPAYCDRNICLKNEYNGIGCEECEVTKSQELYEDAVDREQVNDILGHCIHSQEDYYLAIKMLNELPSVKQESKTGHWEVMYEPKNMVVCSKCGKCAYLYNDRGSAYCPHCGDYKGGKLNG